MKNLDGLYHHQQDRVRGYQKRPRREKPVPVPDPLRELIRELRDALKALRLAVHVHELMVWGDLPVEKPHDRKLYAAGHAVDALIARATAHLDAEAGKEQTTRYVVSDAFEEDYWTCEACKVDWCFTDGGPEENGMKFCPVCGRRIIEFVRPEPEDEDAAAEGEPPAGPGEGKEGA